jgi:4-amino-4-deoxy-L-arabinose transferase-like glycosyltransferase
MATPTVQRSDEHDDAPVAPSRAWRRAVAVGLLAYVVSRVCVMAGAFVRASQVVIDQRKDNEPEQGAVDLISEALTSWDGRWYLEIVRFGYPDRIPANITYEQTEARAAFFPLYPWTVRAADTVLPGGDTLASLFVNFVLGAIAVVLVGLMARRVFSDAVAARAMIVFALFPGSFVMSFAYSEALLIVLAAGSLLLLFDERWWLAGVVAALATATRPNGVAVVAACAVAAFIAIRNERKWSALAAPLLAPIGFVGFQVYVDSTAGETGAWFRVQREAWSEGTSFGATAVENTFGFITSPLSSTADALTVLSLGALAVMAYSAWKKRLPLPWIAFSVVVIALMLIPETVTARPRFVFTAFPLFVAVAAWWPQPPRNATAGVTEDESDPAAAELTWQRQSWTFAAVLCGAGLAVLTNLYAVFGAIP